MGVGQQVDTTDFHVEAIDLLSNQVSCEAGIALVVAIYSALKGVSVQAGLVILGDLSINRYLDTHCGHRDHETSS
jgi:ATP-dependent Lon protease